MRAVVMHNTHAHPKTKAYLAAIAILMMIVAEDGLSMTAALMVLMFAFLLDAHRGDS